MNKITHARPEAQRSNSLCEKRHASRGEAIADLRELARKV